MNLSRLEAIESAVGPVSRWAKATAPRETDMALGGAIEGADRFDEALAGWAPAIQSADADILPNKYVGDARSADLMRNDGYVQAGGNINQNSIVGSFYMLNCKPEMNALGLKDETWETEFQEEVESKYTLSSEGPNCWLDAAGKLTGTQMIRMSIMSVVLMGEDLTASEWIREPGRPFKTAFQCIDPIRLRQPLTKIPDGNTRGGVQMDNNGKVTGYWISKNTAQGYSWTNVLEDEPVLIPARKPWGRKLINHIVESSRPHQTRGLSDMVAGLMETKMARQFRKITLQNAITGAMYAATVESELPPDVVYQSLGAGGDAGTLANAWISQYLQGIGAYMKRGRGVQLDGVKIPHLYPGTKLQLRPVGTPGGIGQDFEASLLRYLSALLGCSYEELSRDYTNTNYSSMKGGLNSSNKFMMARKKFVADRKASFMFQNWFEEQANTGGLETMKYSKLPNLYEPLMMEAYTSCEWIGASRGQIDELKETQAAVMRVDNNLSTYELELGRLGQDWRKVFKQIKREKELVAAYGIEPMLDAMSANTSGGDGEQRSRASGNGKSKNA